MKNQLKKQPGKISLAIDQAYQWYNARGEYDEEEEKKIKFRLPYVHAIIYT